MSVKEKAYYLLSTDTVLQGLLGGTTSNPKVYFFYPLKKIIENLPCITYHFTEQPWDNPNIQGKTAKDGTLTIDIWKKGNTDSIEERVQKIVKETLEFKANLIISTPVPEIDLPMRHQQLIFNIIGG